MGLTYDMHVGAHLHFYAYRGYRVGVCLHANIHLISARTPEQLYRSVPDTSILANIDMCTGVAIDTSTSPRIHRHVL